MITKAATSVASMVVTPLATGATYMGKNHMHMHYFKGYPVKL